MKSKAMIMIVCSCLILSGCEKTNTSQTEDINSAQTKVSAADKKPEVESKTDVTAVSQTETQNYEGYTGLCFNHERSPHPLIFS
jgi:PBP1b-binding outer membrane lipoprotein LpoB